MSSCTHTNPPEVMTMAEIWLREQGLPEDGWPGLTVRHAENTPGGMWQSVVIEIERRGDQWIVTKIDRRDRPLEDQAGLSLV
ncbi:MAG TPA: hypothetical protein VNA04_05365 [Thermoanaerobaculia bacterium]|nr:hypothetical protein [Thermoanaerobaculia bacterium]